MVSPIQAQSLPYGDQVDGNTEASVAPIFKAVEDGNFELVLNYIHQGLINSCKDKVNQDGRSLLYIAASKGFKKISQILIQAGANIDLENKLGATPLLTAAFLGHKEICQFLIQAKANIDKENNGETTPLDAAICQGHKDICKMLIEARADVNKEDKGKNSPLIFSINDNVICQMLIEAGANVNKENEMGDSPLLLAADKGHVKVCKVLIEARADVNKANKTGNTPLIVAADKGHKEICKLLLSLNAKANTISALGFSAYTAIKGMRLLNQKEIKKLFKENLSCNVFVECKEYDKEFRMRKLVGHVIELTGQTDFMLENSRQKYASIGLEGFYNAYILRKVGKSFKLFGKEFPEIIDYAASEMLRNAFLEVGDGNKKSAAEKIAIWKKGGPLIISTGYVGHGATILFWKDICVICNRHNDLQAFTFKNELSEKIITSLEKLKKLKKENYSLFVTKTLAEELQFLDSINSINSLPLLRQKIGNCGYACSEGMILPLLVINEYMNKNINILLQRNTDCDIIKRQIKTFRNWQLFYKLTVLKKYQKYNSRETRLFAPDTALFTRAVDDKFFTQIFSPDRGFDPKLLEHWKIFKKMSALR